MRMGCVCVRAVRGWGAGGAASCCWPQPGVAEAWDVARGLSVRLWQIRCSGVGERRRGSLRDGTEAWAWAPWSAGDAARWSAASGGLAVCVARPLARASRSRRPARAHARGLRACRSARRQRALAGVHACRATAPMAAIIAMARVGPHWMLRPRWPRRWPATRMAAARSGGSERRARAPLGPDVRPRSVAPPGRAPAERAPAAPWRPAQCARASQPQPAFGLAFIIVAPLLPHRRQPRPRCAQPDPSARRHYHRPPRGHRPHGARSRTRPVARLHWTTPPGGSPDSSAARAYLHTR